MTTYTVKVRVTSKYHTTFFEYVDVEEVVGPLTAGDAARCTAEAMYPLSRCVVTEIAEKDPQDE